MGVEQDLQYEKEGALAWITVNRPEQRNAFTFPMYRRIFELAREVDEDDEVRVVIYRGAGGRSFASGTDIRQFLDFHEPQQALDYEQKTIGQNLGRVFAIRKPTIAMIEGFCVGGGLALALSCDLRYASEDSRFGAPPAKLGNIMSLPTMYRMLMLLGEARTLEMLYTARLMEAPEAKEIGLINDALPGADLELRVREVAETIGQNAPLTVTATKAAVHRMMEALAPTFNGAEYVQRCYMSEDFQEGVHAFLEKRRPDWKGR